MKTFTPKGNTVGMIMPSFIMKTNLSHGAKLLYALLCDYSSNKDHCWPSQSRLARKLGCSISSIKRYAAELAKADFVHIQHNSQKSSVYFMLDNPVRHEVKLSYQEHNDEVKLNCHESKMNCEQSKLSYNLNLNNLILRKTPPISPTKSSTDDLGFAKKKQRGRGRSFEFINTDFETFWPQYPKQESKEAARHIWHDLARSGELPALKELSLALQYFCKTESWQRENKRYVPQLVNWLKNKRWNDLSPQELTSLAKELEPAKAFKQQCLPQPENKELSKLKVMFEQFADNFTISSPGIKSMAFGLWSYLHRKDIAPRLCERRDDNIVSYLNDYKTAMLCCA